jgi:hypothetical protein
MHTVKCFCFDSRGILKSDCLGDWVVTDINLQFLSCASKHKSRSNFSSSFKLNSKLARNYFVMIQVFLVTEKEFNFV